MQACAHSKHTYTRHCYVTMLPGLSPTAPTEWLDKDGRYRKEVLERWCCCTVSQSVHVGSFRTHNHQLGVPTKQVLLRRTDSGVEVIEKLGADRNPEVCISPSACMHTSSLLLHSGVAESAHVNTDMSLAF